MDYRTAVSDDLLDTAKDIVDLARRIDKVNTNTVHPTGYTEMPATDGALAAAAIMIASAEEPFEGGRILS